jgi:hypothetical protein
MKLKLCLLAVPIVLSGCLTSEEAFYQNGDIKADASLVGTYSVENEQLSRLIEKSLDHSDQYFIVNEIVISQGTAVHWR